MSDLKHISETLKELKAELELSRKQREELQERMDGSGRISEWLTSTQIAEMLGVTSRAIMMRVKRGTWPKPDQNSRPHKWRYQNVKHLIK